MNPATIKLLRGIWPEVCSILEAELTVTHRALAKARDIDTVRTLQGKALAYESLLHLPEALELLSGSREDE